MNPRICTPALAVAMVVVPAVVVRADVPTESSSRTAESAEVADYTYDRWDVRWGQSLADLPIGTVPDRSEARVGVLETPVNTADQYAHRMRALFTPDVSGTYRFHIAGDDDARLFLNPHGAEPSGASMIAYIAGWTTLRQWDRFASQRSPGFALEAGTSYYLEAIGKEGSGDDHVSVAMQFDGGPIEVVPSRLVEATALGAGGWRVRTPHGLPDRPVPTSDPGWVTTSTVEMIDVGWTAVEGAEWYHVRLEGSGQVVTVDVDDPTVSFDRLVPDSRHLLEVTPMNAAGAAATMTRVVMTERGEYPLPLAPAFPVDAQPSVSFDRWDIGWWTLTSIPDGHAPWWSGALSTGMETTPMQGEHHAARLRAVLIPTETDDYTFHLSSDDDGRLLFNPLGPDAAGAMPIASVSGWTEQYQWDRYQSQRSATFRLEGGARYYIEALAVHALDIDHLEVGWSRPGQPIEVIPAEVLDPTHAGSGGWRPDATDLPAVPGKPMHLQVDSTTTTLHATWVPAKEQWTHGATDFYEVVVEGDGVSLEIVTEDTEVVIEGLPEGGSFWFEVRPWNASGQGHPLAHRVHTDQPKQGSRPPAQPSRDNPGTSSASGRAGSDGNGTTDGNWTLVDQSSVDPPPTAVADAPVNVRPTAVYVPQHGHLVAAVPAVATSTAQRGRAHAPAPLPPSPAGPASASTAVKSPVVSSRDHASGTSGVGGRLPTD